jgi:hypothetical protein
MRKSPAMRQFLHEIITFHHSLLNLLPTTMSSDAAHEETKVQRAMALLQKHPEMKASKAARQTRASYPRLIRRLKGIPPSNSRGGHNKKLGEPQTWALKDHLLMCHALGRSASIDHIIASANSILRCDGSDATVSRRWAKRWLVREKAFVKTLKSRPLSALRHAAHKKEDIEAHFKDYDRCKKH